MLLTLGGSPNRGELMATLDASAFAALSRFFQAEGKYASVFSLHNGPWPSLVTSAVRSSRPAGRE